MSEDHVRAGGHLTHLTTEIADELERSEITYMKDRMKAIQEQSGNPEGIMVEQMGSAHLFYSRTMPWPQFNTVKGLRREDVSQLDDIIAFYAARNRVPQFEIVPGQAHIELFQALAQRGFMQSGFHATLYAQPEAIAELITDDERTTGLLGSPRSARLSEASEASELSGSLRLPKGKLRICQIGEHDVETYATIHCLGTGLGENGISHVARNNTVLMGRPGWSFYIGYVEDVAAAVGVMYEQHGVASLTFAATLPEYRGLGLQTALLRRRISDARHRCAWVVSQAAYLSVSHRNMERVGMRLGYTRATWTKVT
ncbi:GNAT family N-acetyltransferase [Paenibacillus sp. 481]|uniref:GNAT family N-acetyltransferase n=1 Tax=Paenibacillus sp. 481 TaxID=2835869 RepID=UPI001E51C0B9|nr:GNAT family N-acetyltransferase [Paenibacillus sp. 481]UHA72788.1 GNAT family N-acetyltransferase [Paenibacillus sp. 481]